MANKKYIGKVVKSSDVQTSGILSLNEYSLLTQQDLLESKSGEMPFVDNNEISLPTNGLRNLYQFPVTIAGVEAHYITPDGSRLFTCSDTAIREYEITKPHDFTSLNTTPIKTLTLGFETLIEGIFFKPDGKKLFVIGVSLDAILEFNLEVAFDIDTLTYTGRYLNIREDSPHNELNPRSLYFAPDGSKIIITGSTSLSWFQIDLNTPWDILSADTYIKQSNIRTPAATLYGHTFSANGDIVFITDATTDTVYKYNLDTPWDITSRRTNQYYVGLIDISPAGAVFNDDGTKFYFAGNGLDNVYELELSTPYDINTASFNSNVEKYHIFRGGTARTVYSFFFKPDGTRLYILESSNSITEFKLSTAWDPTTISFLNEFSVSDRETAPRDLFFKPDGTKLYVIGQTGDDVNEYSLSTAWDISTATYVQVFSVSAQETAPTSIQFSTDGTKMFVMGTTGDDVNEYTLSTAWDISTASYVRLFSVASQVGTTPQSLTFNGDGTAFYVINGAVINPIIKYSLGTAWDLSTASYDSSEHFSTSFPNATSHMRFNSDGSKMFFLDNGATVNEKAIVSIPLTTAYNINTAQYNVASLYSDETVPTGIHWGNNGNFLYVIGSTGDDVNQYEALIPYKLSTIRFLRTRSIATQETVPQSLYFSPDGTKMFVLGSTGDDVNEYSLSTAWDVSTTTYVRLFSVAAQTTLPTGFAFNSDGTKMFVLGQNNNTVFEYSLATGWDLSTASYTNNSLLISFLHTTGTGLAFNSNGTSMYLVGATSDVVSQIDLTSAYTLAAKNWFYVGDKETAVYSVSFKTDGTKMYVIGTTSDTVHEYNLGTAWDISTSTFNQSLSVSAQEATPQELEFKPDGTKMYVMGSTGDDINEYSLSTPWDISTASFVQLFSVASQEPTPGGLAFKSDGTKFYILGVNNDTIHQYSLGTAWDVSTASYDNVFFKLSSDTTNPFSLTFKSDGTAFYFIDNVATRLLTYELQTAWDLSTVYAPKIFPSAGVVYDFSMHPDGNTAYGYTFVDAGESLIDFYSLNAPFDLQGAQYNGSYDLLSRNDNICVDRLGKTILSHNRTDSTMRIYSLPNKGYTSNNVSYNTPTVDLTAGSFSFSADETSVRAFTFDSTGTKLYLTGTSSRSVHYYTLGTAWDITTATKQNSFDISSYAVTPVGIRLVENGKYLLVFCSTHYQVIKFELSVAYDTSTATIVDKSKHLLYNVDIGLSSTTRLIYNSAYFSYDGKMLYLCSGPFHDSVFQYELKDYVEIINYSSYVTFNNHPLYVQPTVTDREGLRISENGRYLYTCTAADDIEQWKLESPFVVNEKMVLLFTLDVSSLDTVLTSLHFKPDGTKMYFIGQSQDIIREFSLSIPWQLSSATYVTGTSVTSQSATPTALYFNDAGTKAYVLDDTNKALYQYSLGTAWDITTLTYDTISLSVPYNSIQLLNVPLANVTDFSFNGNGTQLNIVVNDATSTNFSLFFRYNLSTAWDISSATYLDFKEVQTRRDVISTSADDNYKNFTFSNKGKNVHYGTSRSDTIVGNKLKVPYDLTTEVFSSIGLKNNITVTDTAPNYISLSENGSILLVCTSTHITCYRLETPFDLNSAVKDYSCFITALSTPLYAFLSEDGTHAFYSRTNSIYKLDFSNVN